MFRKLLLSLSLAAILFAPAAADKTTSPRQPAKAPPASEQPMIDEGGRVENPPEELNLVYRFKEGESNRYQVQMMNRGTYHLLGQKEDVSLSTVTEMFFRQTVKSEEDKLYKVEWALQSGVVRIPDYGNSVITVPELTYSVDERGNVKKISGLENLAVLPGKPQQKTLATLIGQLRFQGFPTKPLKVGNEWTREYALEVPNSEKFTVKTTSKLLGYEKCDGYDCAKIETKYDYPVKLTLDDKTNGKLSLEGKESGLIVTRFAFKEGKMIRAEGDIKADANVTKADGSPGNAFVKLEINAVSRLLPPTKGRKEDG